MPDYPARPGGPLVWAHGGSVPQQRALAAILARMAQTRPELTLLLSGPEPTAPAPLLHTELPPESIPATQHFATHWAPDLVLWAGQALRPALLDAVSRGSANLVLVAAEDLPWTSDAMRWVPDTETGVLALFDRIFTTDAAAARRLRRMGLYSSSITTSGPLTETAPPLDCAQALHEEMAGVLAGRPVWLASRVRPGEVETVLRAHRRASRLAHRLLLILVPADRADAEVTWREAQASGLRLCAWENGDMPDENTQVLVAEGPDDLGLWYRLAPLAFMGGSLVSGFGGHDPFEAAALGAATLYGPNVGRHLAAYSALAEAGAARIVKDADTLSAAVSHLIAPDRAAGMAHAGWDIVTAGAAMTDMVIKHAFALLDEKGKG
ncbi:3-deoxy-D-manno-octulosonic acid transferase [Aestuariicoccus sp. MJ-SS9]|uniref:3-deoxy-D-manno-octulosonic acid transferase n=1 Tax=Aestuariicoccus sp. MJ-SS9 TaxID=3079855 RepID=UPI0029098BCE|nr:glycosyltransferase N-terminal domain-containing protein [Aestuariicoccus sp. MJ-SS9]MDU8911352.1 glycosyltransferase N-terminal domain-containing protein [Aestuariicoccus sp. MJ-SS9]